MNAPQEILTQLLDQAAIDKFFEYLGSDVRSQLNVINKT